MNRLSKPGLKCMAAALIAIAVAIHAINARAQDAGSEAARSYPAKTVRQWLRETAWLSRAVLKRDGGKRENDG